MAHHGNTPAAWTTVCILLVGFVVGGVGVVISNPWVIWIGVAFAPIAAIAGKVLQRLGYGSETTATSPQ